MGKVIYDETDSSSDFADCDWEWSPAFVKCSHEINWT